MNFFKNALIKRALAFVLIVILSVFFVSCSTEGNLIRNNETVGDGWKQYVLNYEKNVNSICISPPYEFSPESSLISIEYYKISGGEAFDRIMSLLIDIEKYATGIGDSKELSGKIIADSITNRYVEGCTLEMNKGSENYFSVSIYKNIISVVTGNSTVYFTTDENLEEVLDEITDIAKTEGKLTKLF